MYFPNMYITNNILNKNKYKRDIILSLPPLLPLNSFGFPRNTQSLQRKNSFLCTSTPMRTPVDPNLRTPQAKNERQKISLRYTLIYARPTSKYNIRNTPHEVSTCSHDLIIAAYSSIVSNDEASVLHGGKAKAK